MGIDLAILSAGPSLNGFLANPPIHERYMGVNRVVTAWECDYWVARDPYTLTAVEPLGWPQVYTCDQEDSDLPIPGRCTVTYQAGVLAELKGDPPPDDIHWARRSAVWALVVAAAVFNPATITLYGYDMEGSEYWDGSPIFRGKFRIPAVHMTKVRWAPEREHLTDVIEWVRQRGIEVHGD